MCFELYKTIFLALVNMVAYVAVNICSFIDNIVISKFLGEHALAGLCQLCDLALSMTSSIISFVILPGI